MNEPVTRTVEDVSPTPPTASSGGEALRGREIGDGAARDEWFAMAADPLVGYGFRRILAVAADPDFATSSASLALASAWRVYRLERIRFLLGATATDPATPERVGRDVVRAGGRFARGVPATLTRIAERRRARVARAGMDEGGIPLGLPTHVRAVMSAIAPSIDLGRHASPAPPPGDPAAERVPGRLRRPRSEGAPTRRARRV